MTAKLSDIESLRPMARRQMESDNWTIDKLAKANYLRLTTYRGVTTRTAQRIIEEAQGLVRHAPDEPVAEQGELELMPDAS